MLILDNFLSPFAYPPNGTVFIKGLASNRNPFVRADNPKGPVQKRFLCAGQVLLNLRRGASGVKPARKRCRQIIMISIGIFHEREIPSYLCSLQYKIRPRVLYRVRARFIPDFGNKMNKT
jgi:hypothetical protein